MDSSNGGDSPLQGDWIWTPEELPRLNQYLFFRKTFTLEASPDSAFCSITAERFYKLWINGVWVGEGPALSHPDEKSYDLHDLTDSLSPGTNVLAVVVQFDGDVTIWDGSWCVPPTRGGFWCRLNGAVTGTPFMVASDDTWATHRPRGWHSQVHYMNDMFFQEAYRLGHDPQDWREPTYDDGDWPRAVVLGGADGGGADGQPLPWRKLVPRDILPLTYRSHRPVKVEAGEIIERFPLDPLPENQPANDDERCSNFALRMSMERVTGTVKATVEGEANLAEGGEGDCVLTNSHPFESYDTFDGVHAATLRLDFGRIYNARLSLEVEGPEGAWLDIGYGPDLVDGQVNPYRSPRTSWADRLVLGEGRHLWRTFFWRQFRYVQITVHNAHAPVRLSEVAAEAVNHTWETTPTSFRCSDKQLEKFWQAAEHTGELSTLDVFNGHPREPANYCADLWHLVPGHIAVHGDGPLYRRYHRLFSVSQLPNGVFMDCCPGKGDPKLIVPESGFWHVRAIWTYFSRFGHIDLLEEHWESVGRWLAFWDEIVNRRGLLEVDKVRPAVGSRFHLPWVDWIPVDRRGEQLHLNAYYLMNLQIAAAWAKKLGDAEAASDYAERAERIASLLRDEFWDEERGLFVDALVEGEQSEMACEPGQGIMLDLNVAESHQAARLFEVWDKSPGSLAEAEIISCFYYMLEGLVKYGYSDFALRLLRRLERPLRLGYETFGETWTVRGWKMNGTWATAAGNRAVAQTNSWPATFLLEHVVGLQPRWGLEGCLRLAPQPLVESAAANWCGHGVEWEAQGNSWHLSARMPRPTDVEFILPYPPERVRSLSVDGSERSVESSIRIEGCTDLDVHLTLNSVE